MTNTELTMSQTKRLSTVNEDATKSEVKLDEEHTESEVKETENPKRQSKLETEDTELRRNSKLTTINTQPTAMHMQEPLECGNVFLNESNEDEATFKCRPMPVSDDEACILTKCCGCCSRSCWREIADFILACFTCDDEFYHVMCCCKRGYKMDDGDNVFYDGSNNLGDATEEYNFEDDNDSKIINDDNDKDDRTPHVDKKGLHDSNDFKGHRESMHVNHTLNSLNLNHASSDNNDHKCHRDSTHGSNTRDSTAHHDSGCHITHNHDSHANDHHVSDSHGGQDGGYGDNSGCGADD